MDDAQFARFMDLIQEGFQQLEAKFDERMDQLESRIDKMHLEMLKPFQSVEDRLNAALVNLPFAAESSVMNSMSGH
jgi:hypothetical protein